LRQVLIMSEANNKVPPLAAGSYNERSE